MSSAVSAQRPVWLGLAGAYSTSATEPNHYATKVGGPACFPGAHPPAGIEAPLCGVCGKPLALVLQAYTPLNTPEHGANLPERCLYLYGCAQQGCGREGRAWRAFRCQLPTPVPTSANAEAPTAPQPDHQPAKHADATLSYANNTSDGFPAAEDMFGFGEDDATNGSAAFDFSDLNSALDSSAQQLLASPAAPADTGGSTRQGGKEQGAVEAVTQETDALGPSFVTCRVPVEACGQTLLPEFYITACEEPQGTHAGVRQQEADHIQELLMRYQQEEASTGNQGPSSTQVPRHPGPSAAPEDDSDGDDSSAGPSGETDSGGWAVEEYEEDEVRGVDLGYLKFQQRLMKQPQQCVRYCWNGHVLWPKRQSPVPTPCPQCGAPRVFEIQIMASLISLMMEAADLLQADSTDSGAASSNSHASGALDQHMASNASISGDGGSEHIPHGARITIPAALTAAANWDMCTLVVFTCSKSCGNAGEGGADRGTWWEEQTVLVNEEECHLSMS